MKLVLECHLSQDIQLKILLHFQEGLFAPLYFLAEFLSRFNFNTMINMIHSFSITLNKIYLNNLFKFY